MDATSVDLDRVVDQDLVLRGDVEVLVALTARVGQIQRVRPRQLHARRQDVVITVTILALRHVLAPADRRAPVRLILVRRYVVAGAAALAAHDEFAVRFMRCRAPVLVAGEAIQIAVGRVGQVVLEGGPVVAFLVARRAVAAFDRLVLLSRLREGWACEQKDDPRETR
jgi:hypothetical protein